MLLVEFGPTHLREDEYKQILSQRIDEYYKFLSKNIFGGKSLRSEFPELGESALFCVTEIHTQEDLDTLTRAVREIVGDANKKSPREEG